MALVQMVCPPPLIRLNIAFDNRPINLCNRAILKLTGYALSGTNMPGKYDCARHGPIEPVGQPQIDIAFLFLAFPVERLHPNFHAIDAGGGLRQHARWLVHD